MARKWRNEDAREELPRGGGVPPLAWEILPTNLVFVPVKTIHKVLLLVREVINHLVHNRQPPLHLDTTVVAVDEALDGVVRDDSDMPKRHPPN